jgi:hypothetical protein
MVIDPHGKQVQIELDVAVVVGGMECDRTSNCCQEWSLAAGAADKAFDVTTNLEGGDGNGDKVSLHEFCCCRNIASHVMSNGLLLFLATFATRLKDWSPDPPEMPWGPRENRHHEVVMDDGVCWDNNLDEVEDDDW